jgi:hypothetical protein
MILRSTRAFSSLPDYEVVGLPALSPVRIIYRIECNENEDDDDDDDDENCRQWKPVQLLNGVRKKVN